MDNNDNIIVEEKAPVKHTISTISLVCGIVSLVGAFTSIIPFISWITSGFIFPAGLAGLILGIVGIKKEHHKHAKVGLILSIIGLVINIILIIISVVLVILGVIGGGVLGAMGNSMSSSYYY